MRIDRDAAAIVVDGEKTVSPDLDLDEMGMAGQRLVHGIVDHLGEQVMHRLLVGAADIHAWPPAHRLEPLQHLDVAGHVAGLAGWARCRAAAAALRGAAGCGFGQVEQSWLLPEAGFLAILAIFWVVACRVR